MYNLFSHMTAIENVMEGLRTVRGMAKKAAEKIAREVADQVVFMENGVVVERGNAEDVLGNPKEERPRAFLNRYLNA